MMSKYPEKGKLDGVGEYSLKEGEDGPYLLLEVGVGVDIKTVAGRASNLAHNGGITVKFDFNDIPLTVTPETSADDAVSCFWKETERRAEEYRRTPEYQSQQRQRRIEVARKQKRAVEMTENLDDATVNDLDKLLPWLVEYTELTDDVEVAADHTAVSERLEARWQRNAHVGQPKEAFATRQVLGEYVVGQAIDCMSHGMPPHPILRRFVDDYRNFDVGAKE